MRAIKLKSSLSNNQAEYEALLIGIEWAHGANIMALEVYRDSQLVVNQAQGTYTVQLEGLQSYVEKARQWKEKFNPFTLSLIIRRDNQQEDRLAKITSGKTQKEEGIPVEMETTISKVSHLIQYVQPTL